MKKDFILKVGDQVTLINPDLIIKNYLSESIFSGIRFDVLRLVCELKEVHKYKVVDVCRTCKRAKIEVGKKKLSIRYSEIKSVQS